MNTGSDEKSHVPSGTWDLLLRQLREELSGEFRVTRELGRGGQAAVYLAEELALRRLVAIKVLSRHTMSDVKVVERFRTEAQIIARLRHQHIITIFSIRQLGELHFFIMQYLEGKPLSELLADVGVLPLELTRAVLHQVGEALDYAHQRGVVHRDIKPANVLFNSEGEAVVTDFGVAKRLEQSGNSNTMIIGTPAYMSPEQCLGEQVSAASDQYALGVLAFQMLTGRLPYEGPALVVMQGHVIGSVPSVGAFSPGCPPAIDQAIQRMLAKDAAKRWPSISDALHALGARDLSDEVVERDRRVLQRLALSRGQTDGSTRALGRVLTPSGPVLAPPVSRAPVAPPTESELRQQVRPSRPTPTAPRTATPRVGAPTTPRTRKLPPSLQPQQLAGASGASGLRNIVLLFVLIAAVGATGYALTRETDPVVKAAPTTTVTKPDTPPPKEPEPPPAPIEYEIVAEEWLSVPLGRYTPIGARVRNKKTKAALPGVRPSYKWDPEGFGTISNDSLAAWANGTAKLHIRVGGTLKTVNVQVVQPALGDSTSLVALGRRSQGPFGAQVLQGQRSASGPASQTPMRGALGELQMLLSSRDSVQLKRRHYNEANDRNQQLRLERLLNFLRDNEQSQVVSCDETAMQNIVNCRFQNPTRGMQLKLLPGSGGQWRFALNSAPAP